MLCTATQPVCDMMRDCTLKPASIYNRIVCYWSSCWVPFCVTVTPKTQIRSNRKFWSNFDQVLIKFWSNHANLIGLDWTLIDSMTPSPILFGFAFLPPPPCWLWPPWSDVYLTEPNNPAGLAVVCQRESRDLGRLRVTLSHSAVAQVFWELHLTPLAAALIEATAVFSGALSPINGVWPDLNYLGGRSSPALNTASATFTALKDALGKEAGEVCETAGF